MFRRMKSSNEITETRINDLVLMWKKDLDGKVPLCVVNLLFLLFSR